MNCRSISGAPRIACDRGWEKWQVGEGLADGLWDTAKGFPLDVQCFIWEEILWVALVLGALGFS